MIAVLVIEDIDITAKQLLALIAESVGDSVELYSAGNIQEANERIREIAAKHPDQVIAVVDAMIPLTPGGAPVPAESAVQTLTMLHPFPSLIFTTAYNGENVVEEWRAKYTSEDYQPRSYFISKGAVDWGDQVVRRIRERIHAPQIEGLLDSVFGRTGSSAVLAKSGRSRIQGLGHRLELLTARISEYFVDLHPDLQKRIELHFDVDSKRTPLEVSLK